MLTIVTGPPCAGKTNYVREHRQPGDIVIDFDVLAVALGSSQSHSHPPHVRRVALVARVAAIEEAVRLHHEADAHVWIVQTWLPDRLRRHYENRGAQVVVLAGHPDEMHRRADAANRPHGWHKLINDWFLDEAARSSPASGRRAAPPNILGMSADSDSRQR